MRHLFILTCLLALTVGCRKQDEALPLNLPATVTSVNDLPATYQPFQEGSAIAGRLKSETQNGNLSGEWRYNERGQLIELRNFRLGKVQLADQYRYDTAGRLRFVQHFDNNCGFSSLSNCTGPVEWTSYNELTTDSEGRVTQSRTYLKINGSWDLRSLSKYDYNAKGQITKLILYDSKQVLARTQTFTYDARGNVMAIREENPQASPDLKDRTFEYSYDTGRNPYFNTVYYASAFFVSPNTQSTPGLTYEYRTDGLPIRMKQDGNVTELTYY